MKTLSIAALTLALLAGCASGYGSKPPAEAVNGVLVGPNGPCATNWPPLMALEDAKPTGEFTVIVRDDGKKQWAFKGKPLYYWAKDTKPGDKTGDGFNKVWQVAKP